MAKQTVTAAASMQELRMTDGLILHQSLYAAAKLGIADLLKDGERSVAELATVLQVKEDALYRVLRFLTGQGVFHETARRTFGNSALSQCLRSNVSESVRSLLIFRGSPYYFSPFGEILFSLETGVPAREKVLGMDAFEYLRCNPEEAHLFDDAMGAISALWAPAIAAAYDFGRWGSLMDVGGGNGLLLAEILKAHPDLSGALADQTHVLEGARQRGFLSGDLAGRARFELCDFFQSIPSGCRAYLMKNVIHDWDDERARQILLNCRQAVPNDGVLLLVEYRLGEDNVPSLGKTLDDVMLTVNGGKQRNLHEHENLLASGGFRLNRTIPVFGEIMILEALPA